VIGMDVGLGANLAEAVTASAGVNPDDTINEFHASAGEPQRVFQSQPGKSGAKTRLQITAAQGVNLSLAIRFHSHRYELFPVVASWPGLAAAIQFRLYDPFAGGQLGGAEEARAAIAHRQ